MAKKKYNYISDIPTEELKNMMMAFGQEKARSVKSARAFLRSIGFEITPKGEMTYNGSIPIVPQQ